MWIIIIKLRDLNNLSKLRQTNNHKLDIESLITLLKRIVLVLFIHECPEKNHINKLSISAMLELKLTPPSCNVWKALLHRIWINIKVPIFGLPLTAINWLSTTWWTCLIQWRSWSKPSADLLPYFISDV